MDARIMELGQLFDQDVSYRIPSFQRPYAWVEEQWEALWDDTRQVAEKVLNSSDASDVLPHFLGAIVVQPRANGASLAQVKRMLVVDGQQRLTTLQLLIKALYMECVAVLPDGPETSTLKDYLFNNDASAGMDYLNVTKMRQSHRLDQADFQNIMDDRSGLPARPIVNAYEYIREQVSDWLSDPAQAPTKARALYEVVTKYLVVAAIELDHRDQPHFIFEILNSRGETLEQADFIKNTVMYEADLVDDEQESHLPWGMFENDWWRTREARGREFQMQLDRFLNFWCTIQMGMSVALPMRRTATAFRSYVDKIKRENGEPVGSIRAIATDIRKAGVVYKNLEESLQTGIEDILKRVKVLEVGVIMPPLLWLYTEDTADHQREESVRALESFLVRRMLCNLGTQGFNALFLELVNNLKHTDAPAGQFVVDWLAGQTAENRLWPDDRRLINYLTTRAMPGNAARRKMVLDVVEHFKRPAMMEPLTGTASLTVEHILPRGWNEEGWPLRLSDDANKEEATERRSEHINLIGNLTLATKSLNTAMSNRSWRDKRQALDQYSALVLNKELLEYNDWHEEVIVQRSTKLAEAIAEIWPRPA